MEEGVSNGEKRRCSLFGRRAFIAWSEAVGQSAGLLNHKIKPGGAGTGMDVVRLGVGVGIGIGIERMSHDPEFLD
jgi:hypothetical protein